MKAGAFGCPCGHREAVVSAALWPLAAATGSPRFGPDLRLVVFDVPILAGVDMRPRPWQERRERVELLARTFDMPFELSPIVEPTTALAEQMVAAA
jgi:hypothetical protein